MVSDSLERRLKNFKAELHDCDDGFPGEKILEYTHNGFQHYGISLIPEEMRKLRDLLDKELNSQD